MVRYVALPPHQMQLYNDIEYYILGHYTYWITISHLYTSYLWCHVSGGSKAIIIKQEELYSGNLCSFYLQILSNFYVFLSKIFLISGAHWSKFSHVKIPKDHFLGHLSIYIKLQVKSRVMWHTWSSPTRKGVHFQHRCFPHRKVFVSNTSVRRLTTRACKRSEQVAREKPPARNMIGQ